MKAILKVGYVVAIVAVVLHILGVVVLLVMGLSEYIKSCFPDKQVICEDILLSSMS